MENEIVRLSERMRILWSGTKVPRRGTKIPRRRTKVPRRGTKVPRRGTKVPRKEQKYSGEEQKYREIPRRGTKRMETIWSLVWKNCTEVDTTGNLERVVSFELCSSVSFIVA